MKNAQRQRIPKVPFSATINQTLPSRRFWIIACGMLGGIISSMAISVGTVSRSSGETALFIGLFGSPLWVKGQSTFLPNDIVLRAYVLAWASACGVYIAWYWARFKQPLRVPRWLLVCLGAVYGIQPGALVAASVDRAYHLWGAAACSVVLAAACFYLPAGNTSIAAPAIEK